MKQADFGHACVAFKLWDIASPGGFQTYPARRAMTAQEPTMAKVNQMMPEVASQTGSLSTWRPTTGQRELRREVQSADDLKL